MVVQHRRELLKHRESRIHNREFISEYQRIVTNARERIRANSFALRLLNVA